MIKLYTCRARHQVFATEESKKLGYYKDDEEFLLYRNAKGNWVATTPYNSKSTNQTFLVKKSGDAKSHWMLNMEHNNITDTYIVQNKKYLAKSIEIFENFKKNHNEWSGEQMS